MLPALIVVPILVLLAALPASGHEFWIEPTQYQVDTGGEVIADLRNGQRFSGTIHAYFEKRAARFDIRQNGETHPYRGRMGDVPALRLPADNPGLLTVIYQSTPQLLTYDSWAKFAEFAAQKDLRDIRARHTARGLPEQDFTERYTRFAKALVAVGDGAGSDAPTGLETEFVALANPFTDDLTAGLPVRLYHQGQPRRDVQVEIFDRAPDGTVSIRQTRTDADGFATIAVDSGHSYLIDAVVLRPAPNRDTAAWETLWAALTFAVP